MTAADGPASATTPRPDADSQRQAPEPAYDADDMMTVAAARMLRDAAVCFVGIGLPSVAANLARMTHAPDLVLVYESGTIGAKPSVLPLSIGDGELAATADVVVSVPEIFNYWLQGGRIDIGFLSAAQIDRFANLNSTVIGPYGQPSIRLPGAGGAPEIATSCGEVIIVMRQSPRTFVQNLDFVTSVGHGAGGPVGGGRSTPQRGKGPVAVITDLGLLTPDPDSSELELTHLHPGVDLETVRHATGWPLKVASRLERTSPPTADELAALRRLRPGRAAP